MKTAFPFIFLIIFAVAAEAQNIRKKTEKNFRHLSETDSVLTADKVYEYDNGGALLFKQEFFYNIQPAGKLLKEVNAKYDASKMILDEHIYTYQKNGIDHERLKTKYISYKAKEEESKYSWRQYYDITEEIMREDTLSYDKAGNLLSRMVYDYRGSTSQSSDNYIYDKNNRLKRWQWFSYWATVNSKSKPVTKKDKKQDYKYRYNNKGQLLKVSGKRYSTKFLETYKYDDSGKITEYVQLKTRKSINPKAERKAKGKYSITEEKLFKIYKNGFLTLEKQSVNGKEMQKTEISYLKDSLVSNRIIYQKGEKSSETRFEYDANGKPVKKFTYNYVNEKVHTVLESFLNSRGNVILEIKTLNSEELSRTVIEYDNNYLLKSVRNFMKTKSGIKLFESSEYQYELY